MPPRWPRRQRTRPFVFAWAMDLLLLSTDQRRGYMVYDHQLHAVLGQRSLTPKISVAAWAYLRPGPSPRRIAPRWPVHGRPRTAAACGTGWASPPPGAAARPGSDPVAVARTFAMRCVRTRPPAPLRRSPSARPRHRTPRAVGTSRIARRPTASRTRGGALVSGACPERLRSRRVQLGSAEADG